MKFTDLFPKRKQSFLSHKLRKRCLAMNSLLSAGKSYNNCQY